MIATESGLVGLLCSSMFSVLASSPMVRLLSYILQASLAALVAYNSLTALWGWPNPTGNAPSGRRLKVRIVIPAHNESAVLPGLLTDLEASTYPLHLVSTWVIDDRSDDNTAQIASQHGAAVARRTEGDSGKGPALAWYLEAEPLGPDEVLIVFDADNRIAPDTIAGIVAAIEAGSEVVQCYLDVTNPQASWVAEASALSYWAGNRMVQLARSNLGWSADLGGTGMALTSQALQDSGGFAPSLTEDQDLGVRLLLNGHRVDWLHQVRIRDEKPASLSVTVNQRARWMAGKRAARRRHLADLLRHPTAAKLDMAIRLVQPGRSFVALLSLVLTLVSLVWPSTWLFPCQVWAGLTALQVLLPIPFLIRDGVPRRHILRYPLLTVLAALWIPVRLVSGRVQGWYHTPHTGINGGGEAGPDL